MGHQLCKLLWPWMTTPTRAPGFLWGGAEKASVPSGPGALRSSPPCPCRGQRAPKEQSHAGLGVTRAKSSGGRGGKGWKEELGQI